MKGKYHKEVVEYDEKSDKLTWNIKKGSKVQVKIHPRLFPEAKKAGKEIYDNLCRKKRNFDRKIGTVQRINKHGHIVLVKFPNGTSSGFNTFELRLQGK